MSRTYNVPELAPGFVGPGHLAAPVISPEDFALNDPFILLMDDQLTCQIDATHRQRSRWVLYEMFGMIGTRARSDNIVRTSHISEGMRSCAFVSSELCEYKDSLLSPRKLKEVP